MGKFGIRKIILMGKNLMNAMNFYTHIFNPLPSASTILDASQYSCQSVYVLLAIAGCDFSMVSLLH